ncbi:MAG: hypothetical protein HYR91_06240 [Flavobacteriia bacterium]|nr:hypothetical protein [Flavobacteriia bacterium]
MKNYILTIGGSALLSKYVTDAQLQMILNVFVGIATVYISNKFKSLKDKNNDSKN